MIDLILSFEFDVIMHQCANFNGDLTHWGLVTPYDDRDLGQHWLR